MEISYRSFVASEIDALEHFLVRDVWPFHTSSHVNGHKVREWVSDGVFESEETRTFWITVDGDAAGLLRLMDLGDDTPLFDLRIASRHRGRGVGSHTVAWLTQYLFTELPRRPTIATHGPEPEAATTRSGTRSYAVTGEQAPSRQ
ncbi:GNAT family N-acetyltransferase [Streptomyces sp. NPDC001843]|uniref:GNAT family N-acetyltransferase n=1 Tax=Streptomyces sp. NPDC001843 TaxID=3364617 RepID=UPI0036B3A70A